jgi:hypothetical protein
MLSRGPKAKCKFSRNHFTDLVKFKLSSKAVEWNSMATTKQGTIEIMCTGHDSWIDLKQAYNLILRIENKLFQISGSQSNQYE